MSHDLQGLRPPEAHDRVGLLFSVTRYVEHWQQVIEAGTRPTPELISRLNQPLPGLQAQAVAVGFGGLSHHLGEYARLLTAGAELPALRGQLAIVSELAWQARQTLTPEQRARFEQGGQPAAAGFGPGVAPPPLITVARSLAAEANAAVREARPAAPAPPGPLAGPPPMVTVPPGISARPPPGALPPLVTAAPGPAARPSEPLPLPLAPTAPQTPHWAPPPALQGSAPPPPPPMAQRALAPGPSVPAPPPPPAAVPVSPLPVNNSGSPSQFGVKNMLGLRAFNQPANAKQPSAPPNARSNPPAAGGSKSSLLSLPGFGSTVDPKGAAKPPLIGPDGSGLPPLEAAAKGRARDSGAKPTAELLERLRPERSSGRVAKRSSVPAKAEPRRAAMRGRTRGEGRGSAGLWVGLGAATLLITLGLVAFFTLRRPSTSNQPNVPGSALPVAARPNSPSEATASRDPEMPRERLLADNERFTALLAQVHGHGGKETPELRSLLNDQAAFASKALSGKCNDGSFTCKAWAEVRDLMVGDHKQAIVKRRRGSDAESTRSRWMVGLKMPGIPVEDDPRVLRVFEFYTQNPVGRETFQSMLFRCGAYRDLIQATLIRYDMPPDLMALAFTESGCEPTAKSPVGAAGLWQFMPETARAYHLRVVEGTIDERYSPFKSTEASIRMLADLRQKLGSWDLVFASYNLGPFGVLARLERAGGDATFWDLVDAGWLPDETANYSPTVEAIALILANLQRLKFSGSQIHAPQNTADLEVPGGTRLGVVARAAATSVAQLRSLNLDFTGDVVPLIPGGAIAVQVPKDVVWQARDSIKELLASKDSADLCVPPTFDWGKQRFTPEMDSACQRRLAAGAGAANPPPR